MIKYLELQNFMSFESIRLDLTSKKNKAKKFSLIYGENGSGKSNLISSLFFFVGTLDTVLNQEKIRELNESDAFNSFNKIEDDELRNEVLAQIIKDNFSSLSQLLDIYKPIDSIDKIMSIKLGYNFDNDDGEYFAKFQNKKIIYEKMTGVINKRIGTIFEISNEKRHLSSSIFKDTEYRNELLDSIDKLWGIHSFSSIFTNEIRVKNIQFIVSRVNEKLLKILNGFQSLSIQYNSRNGQKTTVSIQHKFLKQLENGKTNSKENIELLTFESILNEFFTSLYSDIKRVYYEFIEVDNIYKYQLYEEKLLNNHLTSISFEKESTGTRKLLEIFPLLFAAISGETVFVDEMDSGIHDLLMSEIIEKLSESLNGQFIATTHNTTLMKSIMPENLYILNSDAFGEKEIIAATEYGGSRIQKTNSLQNKYLNGEFGGVPMISNLDFNDVYEKTSILTKITEVGEIENEESAS